MTSQAIASPTVVATPHPWRHAVAIAVQRVLLPLVAASVVAGASAQVTPLADQPLFSSTAVPGNLALPLSVEYPTAVSVAHIGDYDTTRARLGYFDPTKCYSYNLDGANSYFYPDGVATNFVCVNRWSGNFLNWATMQTIDPFRWALTGGNRVVDTATVTVIEKAYASGQGGTGNFPDRSINGVALVAGATPFNLNTLNIRIQGLGNRMRFTAANDVNAGGAPQAPYNPGVALAADTIYEAVVRVQVCNPTAPGGVEANCVRYGNNYKPEGLIQQYSDRIRYSAFGYLNDGNIQRDGGVLRARQKFVGPQTPRPGLPPIANLSQEWDPATGIFFPNPDTADAAATGVTNSGVINYLNKFGQSGSYKTFDPVGELYYAAVRYFKNLGNVPEWSSTAGAPDAGTRATWIDGFPVITNWDDPIQYSCQRNYILGIGDVNTHADKNVPGAGTPTGNEPGKPGSVNADPLDSVAVTNAVGLLEGGLGTTLGLTNPYNGCCSNNSALMAGIAYDSHVRDIRPDNVAAPQTVGMQTISTYWLDVLEYQTYRNTNQFWLAAKYGGFRVPAGFNPNTVTAATFPGLASWSTSGETNNGQPKPDNYFVASRPDSLVAGLTAAFSSIAADLSAYTTSFSTATPQISPLGSASYSAQYDTRTWTGEIEGGLLIFPGPTVNRQWRATERLGAQLAGAGWNTGRRVASFDPVLGTRGQGVAFRATGASRLSDAQLALLDTSYVAADDRAAFVNYLRGDRSNEVGVTGALGYRARTALLGDIVNSKVTAVAGPSALYTDENNPGYSAFRTAYANRMPMVYVGANDGMLHAFNGSMTDAAGGTEVFAYVPSALLAGPSSPSTPNVDGLAALGNPNFVHHFYVDSTPSVFDIDFARAGGPVTGNPTPSWRSVLIGGLGKGGRGYYAIDVTDPGTMTTEGVVASRVLWEFPNRTTPALDAAVFGYSYGLPTVTKTAKWGWVVVFASGYNNVGGRGHFFFVDPRNGDLLERVTTDGLGSGSIANPAGLAHLEGYTRNITDNTAESLYAGDLLGNLWRLDVRQASGAYQSGTDNPRRIARLTSDAAALNGQPVTSRPTMAIHPQTRERYVLVGSGRLLDPSDLGSTQAQTFYAIKDGTLGSFFTPATLPAGQTFPITRNNLVNNINPTAGITPDAARPMGWYEDLGIGAAGNGWRVTSQPDTFFGEVGFASLLPGADACSPGGVSRVYVQDFSTGQSTLLDTSVGAVAGSRIPYSTALPGLVVSFGFFNVNGTTEFAAGSSASNPTTGGSNLQTYQRATTALPGLRRLNWRELPAPQ